MASVAGWLALPSKLLPDALPACSALSVVLLVHSGHPLLLQEARRIEVSQKEHARNKVRARGEQHNIV
jgi:hypothetical protein